MAWACGPIRFEINPGVATPAHQRSVRRAVRRYGLAARRRVSFLGVTEARRSDEGRPSDAPILIEFTWPDDAPRSLGFAEAFTAPADDGRDLRVGGSVYLHPDLVTLDAGATVRLAMHELGHLGGLDHSEDPNSVMHETAAARRYSPAERAAIRSAYGGCADPSTRD